MSLIKVISGGQTGADIGGLRAAHRAGIETGGWAPKGYRTERGPMRYLLGSVYGLKEHESPKYPPRTIANIRDSMMTLIVAETLDGGSALTRDLCFKMKKPVFHIVPSDMNEDFMNFMTEIFGWINKRPHDIINIAGNRESKSPNIGRATEVFLYELFMVLK